MSINSKNTKFGIKVGNAVVNIAGITAIGGLGGGSSATIDTTDLDSVMKEKLMGTPDEGAVSLALNYKPSDAGQTALQNARANSTILQNFEATSALAGKKWSFAGYVQTFELDFAVDKQITVASTIEISGPVTWAPIV